MTVYWESVCVKKVKVGDVYVNLRRTPISASFGCTWLLLLSVNVHVPHEPATTPPVTV